MRLFSPELACEYFRDKIELYLRWGYDVMGERRAFLRFLEVIPEPVLEIGTGRGYFTLALAEMGLDVISLDPDPDAIEFASSLLEGMLGQANVKFVRSSGERIPLPDNSVGSVLLFNLWHHVKEPSLMLHEIKRVIRPGGLIGIVDFSPEGFELVDAVHRDLYGEPHPVENDDVDKAIDFFPGSQVYRYQSRFEKGICIRL